MLWCSDDYRNLNFPMSLAKIPPMADPVNSSIPVAPGDAALGSALCTDCGLCCTGALHNFAVLEPEEVDYARRIGLTLRSEGKPGFTLPCPKLRGSRCSIYVDRPMVCDRYKCALLKRLEAGSIDFEAAAATVVGAKQLFNQVQSVLPEGMTIPMVRSICDASSTTSVETSDRTSQMRLKLALTALTLFLDRHFRNSREGPALTLETLGEARPDTEMM